MNRLKILIISILAIAPGFAAAAPIIALPTDAVGPFKHNVFHSAERNGGTAGTILAWFGLDESKSSSWDPNTGVLDLHVVVYDDSSFTNRIGTASASSGDLLGARFNHNDNSLLGAIQWDFDSAVTAHMGLASNELTQHFMDHQYARDSAGRMSNSFLNRTATLWGADGTMRDDGMFSGATLGVDVVIIIPEPATLLLFGLGLLGIGAQRRFSA